MSSNRSAVAAVTATATATRGGGESISSSNSSINGSRGRMLTSASTSTAVVATATARSNIVAIAQLRSTSDKFQNLLNVAKCARMALDLGQEHQQQQKEEEQKQPSLSALASQHQQQQRQQQQAKVKMLFLPECFGFIGSSSSQTLTEAEDPIFLVNSNNNEHGQQWKNNYKTEQEYQQQFNVHQILKAIIHNENENENDKNNKWALNSKDTDTDTTIKNAATVTPPPKVISLIDGLRTIAKESGLWISGGGIHIAGAPPLASSPLPATRNNDKTTSSTSTNHKNHNEKGRVYNTHIIINSDGAIVAQYNKIHLFDVSIPTQNIHLRESSSTAPGTQLVSCASPIGRLGLSTCYDLRFPEVYTQLTTNTNHDAQILLVPSAFTIPTGAAHWHTLLRGTFMECNSCHYRYYVFILLIPYTTVVL